MQTEQRHQEIRKVTWIGIVVNVLLAMAQVVSGIFAHSQALIADGIHTLADLFSDFVVLITAQQAAKAADEDHPYGHGRFETLSSIFLGGLLIAVAIGIGMRGVESVFADDAQPLEFFALFFALLAIVCKEFLYRYTLRVSQRIKSTLLESNALHHRSDVLSSIVVLIGIGAQLAGVPYMDVLAAIVVAIMIALMGVHLIRKAFAELIDTSLDQELVADITKHILDTDGIVDVHSLRSRSMGGQGYIDTEIRVNPHLSVSEAHFISLHLEQSIKKRYPQIQDVTVHIDPVAHDQHDDIEQLPSRAEVLFSLYSVWESVQDSDKILNIRLHYLGDEIEIEIILPLAFASEAEQTLASNLNHAACQLKYIGKVNIYYAP